MEWFTKFVRPRLVSLQKGISSSRASNAPEWVKCKSCERLLVKDQLKKELYVCHHCQNHMRINAKDRFASLFDDATYEKIPLPVTPDDPLGFKDPTRYSDKLKAQRKKFETTGDALKAAYGTLNQVPLVIAVLDFGFLGGSMGGSVGAGFMKAAEVAVEKKAAFLAITSSGGARIQEGAISLMQMPRTLLAVNMLKQNNLPYLVLLTNPTTGGVSASFAMNGDIQLAEPKAVIGFAGRRVIEQTVGETLPENFQTAEYISSCGLVDMVVHRHQIRDKLASILPILHQNNIPAQSSDNNATIMIAKPSDA